MIKEFFKDLIGIATVEKAEPEASIIHDPKITAAVDDLEKKKAEVARLRREIRMRTPPEVIENIAPEDALHVAAAKVSPTVECNSWNVGSELRKLYAYRKSLSAMERAAVDKVSDRIFELEYKIRDAKFQRLDMSWIMKQRTKEGWPAFAIFSPDKPDCWIEHQEDRTHFGMSLRHEETHFPRFYLNQAYDDVRKRLQKIVEERFEDETGSIKCAKIACSWTGVLPERVRQRINECSPKMLREMGPKGVVKRRENHIPGAATFNVVIVMEAPAWKLDTRVIPVNLDPLVVGEFNDQFWLLDVFDITPLERIAASEFAEWKK